MQSRAELTPAGARQLFRSTTRHHPLNLRAMQSSQMVMRGGVRL